MKSDLDALMAARALDALVVACGGAENAPGYYLSNGAHIKGGIVVKPRGAAPILFCNPMEIEEAQKSGLACYTFNDLNYAEVVREVEGDQARALPILWARCLEKAGVSGGMVGMYGLLDAGVTLELARRIAADHPQYHFQGEIGATVFEVAYQTKDAVEIARLRSVAARASAAMRATWDFLAGHIGTEDGRVIDDAGQPLTIGAVKRFVRHTLLDHDLEDTGMIFAQGRDAGFPHSLGEAATELRTGQAIVFDLFPREIGGGYHFDSTRTWSLGWAPVEVERAYEEVMEAFEIAVRAYQPGIEAKALQRAVLDFFEGKGHPTARSHPGTTVGYTHSLGHGIGLNIHERPHLSHLSADSLAPGSVLTLEPGLYYPERGFGIRVEDIFFIDDDGALISMTDVPKTLVVPLRKS
ncbi:MAG: M24 family metallopeptidase [Aggregatilineales bacterium]